MPRTSNEPPRPARPPDRVIARMIEPQALMPAYRAAVRLKPAARSSKPLVVRNRNHETTTAITRATMKPQCRRIAGRSKIEQAGRSCEVEHLGDRLRAALLAQEVGAQAEQDDLRGDVVEHDRRDDLVGAGPRLEEARDEPPGRAGQHAGGDRDDQDQRGRLALERDRRDRRRPNAPRMNWPSTPMLNTPLRNEIATARPVKISGRRGDERLGDRADRRRDVLGLGVADARPGSSPGRRTRRRPSTP